MALCHEIETGKMTTKSGGFAQWMESTVDNIGVYFAKRREHKERRDAFKTLLKLDARTLKDMGVTRQDVLWASNLPLSQNAASELQLIRKGQLEKGRRHDF